MAPPNIPTSFIPHPSSASAQKAQSAAAGVIWYGAYVVLVGALVLALLVFVYGRILSSTKTSRNTALEQKIAKLDVAAITSFVRLHDRLLTGATLLENHTAFSGFFSIIETVMPSTIRFTSLHVTSKDGADPAFIGIGVAKSYNALAAASLAFSKDTRVKEVLFSGISPNQDGSVAFTLSAKISASAVAFVP
jgi:Tfp pilus assembly protein PilN